MYKRGILFAWICFGSMSLWAQDSLRITLPEAEMKFLQDNLYTLAAEFDIQQQQALEIQSRLYPNPIIGGEVNMSSSESSKMFRAGANGQKAASVQQLLLLGGKRTTAVAMARTNTALAKQSLQELLRSLKLQLNTNFYSTYFDLQTLSKYELQLQQLDTLIRLYEDQAQKGNIALRDVVRLKTAYIRLNNDKTELLQALQAQQRNLQLLLHTTAVVMPDFSGLQWQDYEQSFTLDSLISLAFQNRADWKAVALQQDLASLNTRYQRSLAVPDLSLGAAYDQRGGAFHNQVNLTFGLPLPLWNRNQGNIRSAQIQEKALGNEQQLKQAEINAQVLEAWRNMQRSIQEYQKVRSLYNTDFATVLSGVSENFRNRNISLVEFIDFFESYTESVAEMARVRKQLLLSAEQINYTIAYPIYK